MKVKTHESALSPEKCLDVLESLLVHDLSTKGRIDAMYRTILMTGTIEYFLKNCRTCA